MHGERWRLTEREEKTPLCESLRAQGNTETLSKYVLGQRLITHYICHLTGFHNPLLPPLILDAFNLGNSLSLSVFLLLCQSEMNFSHLPRNTHHTASLQELPVEAKRGHSEAAWEHHYTLRLEQTWGRHQPACTPAAVATAFSGLAAMHPSQLGKCHLVSCKGNSQAANDQRLLCNLPLISSCITACNDGSPEGVSNLREFLI